MKSMIIFLFFFLISPNIFGQNRPAGFGQPGKCYAKAHADSKVIYDFHEETYPIFIGDKSEVIEIAYKTIMVALPSTKWKKCNDIKKGIGTNAKVWCLVEDAGETIEIAVVADTSKTKNFIFENFEIYKNVTLEVPENSSVWTEVICRNRLKKKLLYKIQDALRAEGFYKNENSKYVSKELKTALIDFQKSKELPFGHFDKTTMEALNIKVR
jgi:hypothetical protein